MTTPTSKALAGYEDWSLPADWRELSPKCTRAIQVVAETAQLSNVPGDHRRLADVVWAVRLIADTPPQLRPSQMSELAQIGLDSLREHQRASRSSFKAGRFILGVATGGVSELAGVVARPIVKRVTEYVEERMVGEDGAAETVLQTVWGQCLDALLDSQWRTHERLTLGTDIANELAFLVSWRSLGREWNSPVPEATESTFVDAVRRSVAEYEEIRRSPEAMVNVWVSSPFESPITEHHKMEKKLAKGRLPSEISSALLWYKELEESILRHVFEFSARIGWASNELRKKSTNSADTLATDGTW